MHPSPSRLHTVPLFTALAPEELATVAEAMGERTAEPGDKLTIQGASGYFFFVIEELPTPGSR